jgi:hypothetical protein
VVWRPLEMKWIHVTGRLRKMEHNWACAWRWLHCTTNCGTSGALRIGTSNRQCQSYGWWMAGIDERGGCGRNERGGRCMMRRLTTGLIIAYGSNYGWWPAWQPARRCELTRVRLFASEAWKGTFKCIVCAEGAASACTVPSRCAKYTFPLPHGCWQRACARAGKADRLRGMAGERQRMHGPR